MTKKRKQYKSDWQLTFTISGEPKLALDGQVMHKATALAKRGDFAYMAELELVNWSEDIAAFFEKVRSVFFDAEVNGLPEFPDMAETEPPVKAENTIPDTATKEPPEESSPEPVGEAEANPDYEISFYPAQDPETNPAQSSLW